MTVVQTVPIDSRTQEIAQIVDTAMAAKGIASYSVTAGTEGFKWTVAKGMTDLGRQKPLTDDYYLLTASVAKTVSVFSFAERFTGAS